MDARLLALAALIFSTAPPSHAEAPGNGRLVLEDSFDRPKLGEGWFINNGEWKIADGVLRVRELAEDHHSASARRTLTTSDAVYELRFRFIEGGKAFHLGFDPAKGELDKKGHLFSVIITPTGWKIPKHVDKKRPQEDPNEVLAEEETLFTKDTWHTLRVTTRGAGVTAQIDGKEALSGAHPSFGVKKPTLVFRCLGDGVEVDDLRVWVPAS
jgi:hypothetical protein